MKPHAWKLAARHGLRVVRAWPGRHWRGELGLACAFAVNLLALDLLLGAIVLGWETAEPILHPVVSAVLTVGAVLAGLGIALWQMMGLWRCALRHLRLSDRPLWGRLAQLLVVVGFVQIGTVSLACAVPLAGHISRALVPGTPGYSVQAARAGRLLVVTGPFELGIAWRVRRALEAHPQVRQVRLDSQGGLTAEARRIRDLILERGLTTVSVRGCYSACTIPFMAGRQRLIASGARLGFHAYSAPLATRLHLLWEYARDRRFFRARGVPSDFIERAFATPPRQIWLPSTEDLFDARVVTGRYSGLDAG